MAGQVEMRRQGMKVGGKERWGWSWMVAAGEPHITSSFFPPLPHSHSHSHSSRIHCTQQLLPHTTRTGGRNLRESNSTTIYQQHTHKLWRCKAKHNLVDRREEEEKERKGKEGGATTQQTHTHTHNFHQEASWDTTTEEGGRKLGRRSNLTHRKTDSPIWGLQQVLVTVCLCREYRNWANGGLR